MTSYCPSCGAANRAQARFCANCGHQLESEPKPAQAPIRYRGTPGAAELQAHSYGSTLGTSDERTWAMAAHLCALFAPVLGPLVVYLLKKDESSFIEEQAREALNFQIAASLSSIIMVIAGAVTLGFAWCLMLPWAILVFVWPIQATISTNRGEHYRYPFTLRLIS